MSRRRPPSGFHWCRVGYRVSNPDEIELDNDIITTGSSQPTADDVELQKTHDDDALLTQKQEALIDLVHTLPSESDNVDEPEILNHLEDHESGDYEPGDLDPETYYAEDYQDEPDYDHSNAEHYEDAEEEEDTLGYYPDGTKRTLTDEQIAIFRHTELQMIERRRKRELNGDKNVQISAMEASYFLDDCTTVPSAKSGPCDPAPGQTKPSREEVPYDDRNKRKWESFIEELDPVQGSMTHRRLARELDAQKSESIEMDYGE